MRAKRIALSLMLLSGAWSGGSAADPAPPAPDQLVPKLSVPVREVNLGEVVKGEQVEARFELRNEGEAPLRILRVKPG